MTNGLLIALLSLTGAMFILVVACLIVVVKSKGKTGSSDVVIQQKTQEMQSSLAHTIAVSNNALIEHFKMFGEMLSSNMGMISNIINQNNNNLASSISESNAILQRQIAEFFALVDSKMNEMRQGVDKGLAEVRGDNQTQLDKMRETVDEKLTSTLNDRISKSFSLISERLEAVSRSLGEMKSLSDGVINLNKVLSNIKTRGNWGELALDSLLEQLLAPEQFKKQFSIKGREQVDFAVVLPGDERNPVYLPIDAKFPMVDYERLVDASENSNKEAFEKASKDLVARIRLEAKDISSKYINPPHTTDFAIMYLPVEGLFAEVVRREGLIDELQSKFRIMVCGPTTITALLNSLQLGFRTLAIKNRSSEIFSLLATFKTEFTKFSVLLAKTQKQVDTAGATMRLANARTQVIQRKLSGVEKLAEGELDALTASDVLDNEMDEVVEGVDDES